MIVEKGNYVTVEYEGKLEDGSVFDSTAKHGEPLSFEAGVGQMIKGFDEAVLGMKIGEEKKVTLKPEEAYGEYNPTYVLNIPKNNFPPEAKEGMIIGLPTPMGKVPAVIKKIGETEITLDLNSPLAGKTLIFKIKIVDISDSVPEDECGCGCGDECGCEDEEEGHSCGCGCGH